MAAGQLNRAAILTILKDRYPFGAKIWETFNTGAPLLDAVESGTGFPRIAEMDAEGQRLRIPLWTGGNPNAAVPVPETGGYPRPGYQDYNEAIYNIATFVQSVTLTGLSRAVSRGGASSVARAFDVEMEKQPINASQRVNRALHSDGSGLQATISSRTATTVTVPATTDMSRFAVGMELQIRALLNAATVYSGQDNLNQALVVSAINAATFTLTFVNEAGGAVDFTAGANPVPEDDTTGLYLFNTCGGAQGTSFDMFGLGVMCTAANPATWGQAQANAQYGSIDRTAGAAGDPNWQAYVLAGGGVAFSLTRHVQVVERQLEIRTGTTWGGRLLCVVWHPHYYSIANEMERDRRTGPEVRLRRGNWPMMQYSNILFLRDHMAERTVARFVNPRATYRYIMTPWYWEDETGSTMERQSTTTGRPTNVFRMNMLSRQQVLSTQCHGNASVTGLVSVAA